MSEQVMRKDGLTMGRVEARVAVGAGATGSVRSGRATAAAAFSQWSAVAGGATAAAAGSAAAVRARVRARGRDQLCAIRSRIMFFSFSALEGLGR